MSEAHGKLALFCNDILDEREKEEDENDETEDDNSDLEEGGMDVSLPSSTKSKYSRIPHIHSEFLATMTAGSYLKGEQT